MDKIKVYADTNMVQDFFVNQARALKGKEPFKCLKSWNFSWIT